MDDDFDSLGKWRRQIEAMNAPMRVFQKQQDLLRDPLREIRERQKLFDLASGATGVGSILESLHTKSLAEQHAEMVRPLIDRMSAAGLASRASDSIAALMASDMHQRSLQAQIKDLLGPTTVASALAEASYGRGLASGVGDAIRGNLGNIASTIAGLQNPFSIETIAKRMSVNTAMIEAAHAYLSEEEELAAGEDEVVSAAKKVVETLNQNTVKRFEEMSWLEVIGALYFLLTLLIQYNANLAEQLHYKVAEQTFEQTEDNAEEIATLKRLADESAETINAIAARKAEYERIADLPRAVAPRGANVRVEPKGRAERITVLAEGQQCAVEKVSGRWASCTVFDELTQQPLTGWVWKGSLQFLN